jgi:hypothetical protein
MPARQYRSTVEAKTLNQTITNSSTTIVLNSVTTLPTTYPYTLVLNPDTLTEEIVTVTASAGGNSLTVTRGQDGTTAQAHNLGAAVRHMITARDLQEPQDHINNGGYHIIVCTSSTRPGSPVDGQHIYETNTDKTLSWDGTAWNPVSGAAAYQAGAPSNPSVGSLWVDSDETASQLNTNDFLLKSDASAASGYVSKVGGDTVVASGAAVKPLVLKGASSQTANLQEWQDSTGAVVASVSPTGNIVGSGLTLIKKQTIGSGVSSVSVTNAFSATYEAYKVILVGGVTSTNDAINFQLGPTSVSGYNSQYYQVLIYANLGGGAVTTVAVSNGSVLPYCTYSFGANGYNSSIELFSPFATKYTEIQATRGGIAAGANVGSSIGYHNSTASFSGFQLIPASGTMTGGTIYVYGYGTN